MKKCRRQCSHLPGQVLLLFVGQNLPSEKSTFAWSLPFLGASPPISCRKRRAASWIGCVSNAARSADTIREAPPSPVSCTVVIAARITLYGCFSGSTSASTLGPHRQRCSSLVPITYSLTLSSKESFELGSSLHIGTTEKPSSRFIVSELDTGPMLALSRRF